MAVNIDQQKLQEWKSRYGEVIPLELGEGNPTLIVRKPTRDDIVMFTRQAGKNTYAACNNLLMGCLLHPEADVVKRFFDDKPAAALGLGNKLAELAGGDVEITVGKL
jgi:hypothetical protein